MRRNAGATALKSARSVSPSAGDVQPFVSETKRPQGLEERLAKIPSFGLGSLVTAELVERFLDARGPSVEASTRRQEGERDTETKQRGEDVKGRRASPATEEAKPSRPLHVNGGSIDSKAQHSRLVHVTKDIATGNGSGSNGGSEGAGGSARSGRRWWPPSHVAGTPTKGVSRSAAGGGSPCSAGGTSSASTTPLPTTSIQPSSRVDGAPRQTASAARSASGPSPKIAGFSVPVVDQNAGKVIQRGEVLEEGISMERKQMQVRLQLIQDERDAERKQCSLLEDKLREVSSERDSVTRLLENEVASAAQAGKIWDIERHTMLEEHSENAALCEARLQSTEDHAQNEIKRLRLELRTQDGESVALSELQAACSELVEVQTLRSTSSLTCIGGTPSTSSSVKFKHSLPPGLEKRIMFREAAVVFRHFCAWVEYLTVRKESHLNPQQMEFGHLGPPPPSRLPDADMLPHGSLKGQTHPPPVLQADLPQFGGACATNAYPGRLPGDIRVRPPVHDLSEARGQRGRQPCGPPSGVRPANAPPVPRHLQVPSHPPSGAGLLESKWLIGQLRNLEQKLLERRAEVVRTRSHCQAADCEVAELKAQLKAIDEFSRHSRLNESYESQTFHPADSESGVAQ